VFMPRPWHSPDRPGDATGLSVNRAALTTIDRAATMTHSGEKAHVAELAVREVKSLGLSVAPDPLPDDRSHALIPELNSLDARVPDQLKRIEEWAIALRDTAKLSYFA